MLPETAYAACFSASPLSNHKTLRIRDVDLLGTPYPRGLTCKKALRFSSLGRKGERRGGKGEGGKERRERRGGKGEEGKERGKKGEGT